MALSQILAGSSGGCRGLMDFEEQGDTAQQDGSRSRMGAGRVSYSRMLLGAAVTGATPESLSPKRGNQKNKSPFNKQGILQRAWPSNFLMIWGHKIVSACRAQGFYTRPARFLYCSIKS